MTRPLCLSHFAETLATFRLVTLTLGSGNEGIDHDLRAVEEVTELRLPDGQQSGIGPRHADLEPKHRELAQRTYGLDKVVTSKDLLFASSSFPWAFKESLRGT